MSRSRSTASLTSLLSAGGAVATLRVPLRAPQTPPSDKTGLDQQIRRCQNWPTASLTSVLHPGGAVAALRVLLRATQNIFQTGQFVFGYFQTKLSFTKAIKRGCQTQFTALLNPVGVGATVHMLLDALYPPAHVTRLYITAIIHPTANLLTPVGHTVPVVEDVLIEGQLHTSCRSANTTA